MSRSLFLELARQKLRMPVGADLILHRQPDAKGILRDGRRLGQVIAEAARLFRTPLAFPIMDLQLEKHFLLQILEPESQESLDRHLESAPTQAVLDRFYQTLPKAPLPPRMAANVEAIAEVARVPGLYPVGMCIGPFSLMTKMLADPILPVYSAGLGETAAENSEVALVETALELAMAVIERSMDAQLAAGAKGFFIAEPAASSVYISPKQLESGADIFERYVLALHRRLAPRLSKAGAELIFHCCGELTPGMVAAYGQLRPALLSLGSSRCLWEDAKLIPADVVLYGNLPSKRFYSDTVLPESSVLSLAEELAAIMESTGHPFILGTECDTLHVEGCGDTILRKVMRMCRLPWPIE